MEDCFHDKAWNHRVDLSIVTSAKFQSVRDAFHHLTLKTARHFGHVSIPYLSSDDLIFFRFLFCVGFRVVYCGLIPKCKEIVSFPSLVGNCQDVLPIHICPNFWVCCTKGCIGNGAFARKQNNICISSAFIVI